MPNFMALLTSGNTAVQLIFSTNVGLTTLYSRLKEPCSGKDCLRQLRTIFAL